MSDSVSAILTRCVRLKLCSLNAGGTKVDSLVRESQENRALQVVPTPIDRPQSGRSMGVGMEGMICLRFLGLASQAINRHRSAIKNQHNWSSKSTSKRPQVTRLLSDPCSCCAASGANAADRSPVHPIRGVAPSTRHNSEHERRHSVLHVPQPCCSVLAPGQARGVISNQRIKKPFAETKVKSRQTGNCYSQYRLDDRERGGRAEASARRLLATGYHPVGKYSNNPLDHLLS